MDLYAETGNLTMLPEITTERLLLRAVRPEDSAAVTAVMNDFEVSKWLAVVPYPYTQEDADWFGKEVQEGNFTAWYIWHGRDLVGSVGLDEGSLGYWIARGAWGMGFATEASRAVVDYYFATFAADCLVSSYFVGNTGSCNVLTKLGFRDVGAKASHSVARGCDVDARAMQLTRAEWQARRNG